MDLNEMQSVKDEDAKALASEIKGIFMKTSSKTGEKFLGSYKDLKEENPKGSNEGTSKCCSCFK